MDKARKAVLIRSLLKEYARWSIEFDAEKLRDQIPSWAVNHTEQAFLEDVLGEMDSIVQIYLVTGKGEDII